MKSNFKLIKMQVFVLLLFKINKFVKNFKLIVTCKKVSKIFKIIKNMMIVKKSIYKIYRHSKHFYKAI